MNVEDLNVIFKEMEFLVKTVKEKKTDGFNENNGVALVNNIFA